MKKHSRQRDAIIEYLAGTKSHPTADEVYDKVRIQYPNISLGTVYRNLNQLYEDGEVRKISCGGPDHFDYTTADHAHFACRRCHRVYDLSMDMDNLKGNEANIPGEIQSCDLIFYGICHSCAV